MLHPPIFHATKTHSKRASNLITLLRLRLWGRLCGACFKRTLCLSDSYQTLARVLIRELVGFSLLELLDNGFSRWRGLETESLSTLKGTAREES
jgi:hypothetical protein